MPIKLISSHRLETYNQAKKKNLKEIAWLTVGYGFLLMGGIILIAELFN